MNKMTKWMWIIGLLFVACTDDEEGGTTLPPEVPENDLNISVPEESTTWAPGMAFQPYPGMPEKTPGEKVHVVVIDQDHHGDVIMHVLRNESWAWWINDTDKANLEQCFFPTHEDIILDITESYNTGDLAGRECDMVNYSVSQNWYHTAAMTIDTYEEIFQDDFPHTVVSGFADKGHIHAHSS